MNPATTRFATLMSSVSLLTLTNVWTAQFQEVAQAQTLRVTPQQFAQAQTDQQVAQAQTAQAAPEVIPEQVLITGSLIHGTAAVGVPVTNLGVQDFTETGNVTIGDLFRTVPEANVAPGPSAVNSGGHQERETRVNIRGLDATGPRSLLMVDGVRNPPQADGLCAIDPSIIPALALDRVDVLVDGASATYGSDAIAGVINVVLKRGFDGATTLLHVGQPTDGGGTQFQASQLFGRTWNGGDLTLTYEWSNEQAVSAKIHPLFTVTYTPWGEQDTAVPLGASIPGTISTGAPVVSGFTSVATAPAPGALGLPGTICTNCYSVPKGTGGNFNASLNNGLGPLTAGSASPISWANLLTHAGANNYVDPLSSSGWELAAQQKNSAVFTFDQILLPGINLFAEGYYTNRRVEERVPPFDGQGASNSLLTGVVVSTTNPYYPAGAPAGLRISYDLAMEVPPTTPAFEISWRYMGGVNLDLPFGWDGKIYGASTFEEDEAVHHFASKSAVSVALGDTVAGTDAAGLSVGNITKPANIPYLNLFCDPTAFQCNSPTTLAYIAATSLVGARYTIEEYGGNFDGPLFDVPAGQVKAAVGALYDDNWVDGFNFNNQSVAPYGNLAVPLTQDIEPFQNWAAFTQVDIPVFGDNFNLPAVRRLDLEASWRHDDYFNNPFLTGGTNNPKLAFTWLVDEIAGATIRGSWGSSFRFANEGEFSEVLSAADQSYNLGAGSAGGVTVQCNSNGQPTAGTAAAGLFAAGFGCGSSPGGIAYSGAPTALLRDYVTPAGVATTREGGTSLLPEKAIEYSAGIELAPQIDLLRGFDLQVTWYSVRIKNVLAGNLTTTGGTLSDPNQLYHYILPSSLGCPVADNANPTLCAPFEIMALGALSQPQSTSPTSQLTNVYWLNDSGTTNQGFVHVEGIDWNGSYNIDLGDLGAWNTGITGTYYLHRWFQTTAGGAITDALSQNLAAAAGVNQNAVETLPRMRYRARLGWSDGPYSATLFANYVSHYFAFTELVPPNVNFQCTASGGTVGGGTFPCAINNFTQYLPSFYTFDLSLGYNTGDIPANDYLKRITLQLTIQNLMGKHPSQEFGPSTSTRNPGGYDTIEPDIGRVIGVTIVKNW